jgi:hypothetical protein
VLIFLFQYKVHTLRLTVEHNIRQMSPATLLAHSNDNDAHFKSCARVGFSSLQSFRILISYSYLKSLNYKGRHLNAALNIYHLLNCVCWRSVDVIFCDQALASGVRSVQPDFWQDVRVLFPRMTFVKCTHHLRRPEERSL